VPLSRAICCRPCLPGELPKVSQLKDPAAKAVAIVSVGCHASSGKQYKALQCEQEGSSFVTGGCSAGFERHLSACRGLRRHACACAGAHTELRRHETSGRAPHGSPPHDRSGHPAVPCTTPPFVACARARGVCAGFSQAERINTYYYDEYYPVGQVECCTPAVLLSTGEVWQLTRCDCAPSHTKDCGGEQTNRLLWGFAQWR
jgi:hypothetical protein